MWVKRHAWETKMLLMIDNYDSFTYNLVQYLGELGEDIVVKRNDCVTLDEIEAMAPDRIVISPRPCTPLQLSNGWVFHSIARSPSCDKQAPTVYAFLHISRQPTARRCVVRGYETAGDPTSHAA